MSVKSKIIDFFAKSFYPQNVFAKSIKKQISNNVGIQIVDVPCGNGETSWNFSTNKKCKVYGYDISEDSIRIAKQRFKSNNLEFEVSSIFDALNKHSSINYICIINSLFLLPSPEKILDLAISKVKPDGLVFVIVPNTEGKNFKWFNREKESAINSLKLAPYEFNLYFNNDCMRLRKVIPIAYAHNLGRIDTKYFSVFSHIYLTILNKIQTVFKIGLPNYFLLLLEKV